jgi:hypothetical protein
MLRSSLRILLLSEKYKILFSKHDFLVIKSNIFQFYKIPLQEVKFLINILPFYISTRACIICVCNYSTSKENQKFSFTHSNVHV